MNEIELKKIVVQRITAHSNPVPPGTANELLQQSLPDLEVILEKLASTQELENLKEAAAARVREAQAQRASDGAWGATLVRVTLNGKFLADTEANRNILEGLLNPGEHPTEAGYRTLVLQFPTKFSWFTPQAKQTDADRQAEFAKICRENNLSECEANKQLHKDGVSLDAWAGASGIERAQYANEAALARQHFLIHTATPSQLKAESRYQSATEHAAAVKAEADRSQQIVLSQQQHYPPLPATNQNGEIIDAAYLRKISTINFPLFKRLVRQHGSGNVTARLRSEN